MSGCHIPGRFFESECLVPFTDLTKMDDQHLISHMMTPPECYIHVSNLACMNDEYLQTAAEYAREDKLDRMLIR